MTEPRCLNCKPDCGWPTYLAHVQESVASAPMRCCACGCAGWQEEMPEDEVSHE